MDCQPWTCKSSSRQEEEPRYIYFQGMLITNSKFIKDLIAHILSDPMERIPTPEDIQRIVDEVRTAFSVLFLTHLVLPKQRTGRKRPAKCQP